MKRMILILVIFGLLTSMAFANGGENVGWWNGSSWFIKGQGGVVYDKSDMAGVVQTSFGRLIYKNIAVFGKYEDLNVSGVCLENYNAKITWFARSPKDQGKLNLYLTTGAGVFHKPGDQDFSCEMGFGVLVPLASMSPLFEITVGRVDNRWMVSPTVGMQIGLEF
jgi:hypothetical protein